MPRLPNNPERGATVPAGWGRDMIDAIRGSRLFADGSTRPPGGTVRDHLAARQAPVAETRVVGDANVLHARKESVERMERIPGLPIDVRRIDALGLHGFRARPVGAPGGPGQMFVVREEVGEGARIAYMPITYRAKMYWRNPFVYTSQGTLHSAVVLRGPDLSVIETVYLQGATPGPRDLVRRVSGGQYPNNVHLRATQALEQLGASVVHCDVCFGWTGAISSWVIVFGAYKMIYPSPQSGYIGVGPGTKALDVDDPAARVSVTADTISIQLMGGA